MEKIGPDHYRFVDEMDEEGRVYVACQTFTVIKETPRGYWVLDSRFGGWHSGATPKHAKHFVLKDSRVRFCYPDKRQAFGSYRVRKERQIEHLKRQMRRAIVALKATTKIVTDEEAIGAIGGWRYGHDGRLPCGNYKEWWRI